MAALNDLYTQQNERLFDMLFRHQVYLEGYKTGLAANYRELLTKLYVSFARYLRETRYQSVDQFTKAQLTTFVYNFRQEQTKFYSDYTAELIDILQKFLVVDVEIHKAIAQTVTGKTLAQISQPLRRNVSVAAYQLLDIAYQADYALVGNHYELTPAYVSNENASGIYGVAAVADTSNGRLWANIINSPVPANGLFLISMLDDFGTYSGNAITALLNKGYANAWTMQELESKLFGVGVDFVGGLFGLLLAQQTSVLNTGVQHVSSEAQAAVDSLYFEQYQWVAVLDNKTTQICIDRDGNVYIYGQGPLPPAHYNCRSKAVPIATGQHLHDVSKTYATWLETQPKSFVDDASLTKPLTLDEFQGKVKYILGDVPDAL